MARIVPAIGALASDLRVAFGDPPPSDIEAAEQTGMSLSLEADREVELGNGLADSGKRRDAIVHLRRAISLDPDCEAAHAALATQLGNEDVDPPPRRRSSWQLRTKSLDDHEQRWLTAERAYYPRRLSECGSSPTATTSRCGRRVPPGAGRAWRLATPRRPTSPTR